MGEKKKKAKAFDFLMTKKKGDNHKMNDSPRDSKETDIPKIIKKVSFSHIISA